jgi:hypothetical protein
MGAAFWRMLPWQSPQRALKSAEISQGSGSLPPPDADAPPSMLVGVWTDEASGVNPAPASFVTAAAH